MVTSVRPPIRVLLAKVGLDGHDRGIKLVARALCEAGMEVVYTGLWQTPAQVARTALVEDVDVVGVSLLSGAHQTIIPQLLDLLRSEGLNDVPVIVGGIIPDADIPSLQDAGVARILGPGTSLSMIVDSFRGVCQSPHAAGSMRK